MKPTAKELHLEAMVVSLMLSHPESEKLRHAYEQISTAYERLMKSRTYTKEEIDWFMARREQTIQQIGKKPEEVFPTPMISDVMTA